MSLSNGKIVGNQTSVSAVFKKAMDHTSQWPDKDEFLDVIFWGRQIVSVVLGLVFGITQFQGALALLTFCGLNCGAVFMYVNRFHSIDEEEFGGVFEIVKEGFMTAFSTFMVVWILTFTIVLSAQSSGGSMDDAMLR